MPREEIIYPTRHKAHVRIETGRRDVVCLGLGNEGMQMVLSRPDHRTLDERPAEPTPSVISVYQDVPDPADATPIAGSTSSSPTMRRLSSAISERHLPDSTHFRISARSLSVKS